METVFLKKANFLTVTEERKQQELSTRHLPGRGRKQMKLTSADRQASSHEERQLRSCMDPPGGSKLAPLLLPMREKHENPQQSGIDGSLQPQLF